MLELWKLTAVLQLSIVSNLCLTYTIYNHVYTSSVYIKQINLHELLGKDFSKFTEIYIYIRDIHSDTFACWHKLIVAFAVK